MNQNTKKKLVTSKSQAETPEPIATKDRLKGVAWRGVQCCLFLSLASSRLQHFRSLPCECVISDGIFGWYILVGEPLASMKMPLLRAPACT